ncbi:MAG: restriction endonuclease [Bryobacterales bacterium]|nr:restriction endonuclease [Bryobacterales bacterium]
MELSAPALLDLIAPDVAVTSQFNVQVKQKTGIDYGDVHGVEQLLIMKTNSPNEYSILISSADSFTEPCRKLAAANGVILVDGMQFAEIILKHAYV